MPDEPQISTKCTICGKIIATGNLSTGVVCPEHIVDKPKHAGGRPPKYATPEQMQTAVDNYFLETPEARQGVCDMALFLGFVSRQSFCDYQGYGPEYSDIIKKAKCRLEALGERQLSESAKPTGAIFWLKNHGWKDERSLGITGGFTLEIIRAADEASKTPANAG